MKKVPSLYLSLTYVLIACCMGISSLAHAAVHAMKAPPAAEQPWISGKTFGDQSPYAGFALRAEPGHTARNTGQFALWEKLKSSKLGRAFSKTGGKTNTFPQIIYILLALIGFAWVAMGAMDNWKGSRWVVNLILSLLFWLPGLIHAIVVMPHYY